MSVLEARRRILLNQPHLIDASGNPISFSTDMAAKMGVKAHFSPVQEGTGDPSPSNVRPISGWTGCNVSHSGADTSNPTTYPVTFPAVGKNLLNNTLTTTTLPNGITATVNADKSVTLTGTATSSGSLQLGKISLPAGSYIAKKAVSNVVYINIAGVTNIYGSDKTFTLSEAVSDKNVSIQIGNGAELNNTIYPMIEAGSSSSAYEPFTNTIYGGYVDLDAGVVVATHVSVTADGVNVKANYGYERQTEGTFGAGIVYLEPQGKTVPYLNTCLVKASNLKVSKMYLTDVPYIFEPGAGMMYVIFYVGKILEHPEITTNQERIAFTNAWLKEHPVQLVYELYEPITYPLTPQIIKTLKGQNTIWSDTNGNVDIKYWKH